MVIAAGRLTKPNSAVAKRTRSAARRPRSCISRAISKRTCDSALPRESWTAVTGSWTSAKPSGSAGRLAVERAAAARRSPPPSPGGSSRSGARRPRSPRRRRAARPRTRRPRGGRSWASPAGGGCSRGGRVAASRSPSPSRARGHAPGPGGQGGDGVPQVEAQGGEHLVVARAAEVEAGAGLADPLRQAGLEGGVDVLVVERDLQSPAACSRASSSSPARMAARSSAARSPASCEHLGVGDRGAHVVGDEAGVEAVVLAGGVAQDPLVERLALVPEAAHAASSSCISAKARTSRA